MLNRLFCGTFFSASRRQNWAIPPCTYSVRILPSFWMCDHYCLPWSNWRTLASYDRSLRHLHCKKEWLIYLDKESEDLKRENDILKYKWNYSLEMWINNIYHNCNLYRDTQLVLKERKSKSRWLISVKESSVSSLAKKPCLTYFKCKNNETFNYFTLSNS